MNEWSLIPLFWGALIFLLVNAFACLWRGLAGPTLPDRILAANVIGTKTMVVLVLLGLAREQGVWLDVALVYGLLSFTVTLVASRLLETGRMKGHLERVMLANAHALLVSFLVIAGAAFFFIGTLGLLRFPDFYTRVHAVTKCDALGAGWCCSVLRSGTDRTGKACASWP